MDLNSLEAKLAGLNMNLGSSSNAPPPTAPTAPKAKPAPAPKSSTRRKKTKTSSSAASSTTTSTSSRFDKLYQQGKKKLAKQEKLRKSKPAGCTFNPRTNVDRRSRQSSSSSSSSTPSTSQSRFDRLYAEASKTKKKLDAERKAKEDHPDGCTFNPRTNQDKRKQKIQVAKDGESSDAGSRGKSSTGARRDSRFHRLYEDAAKTRAKLASERQKRADQAGTFKPKITKKAQRSASPSPGARFDKLYKDGQRDLDSQRAKQRADRELQGCTFSPAINKTSSTRSSSARRSRGSAGDSDSFEDRLLEYGKRAEERLDRKRMEANSLRDREATFRPNTSLSKKGKSRRSMGGGGGGGGGGNYNGRYNANETVEEAAKRLSQVETKEQYEKRLERRRQELQELTGATFKPRLNKRSSRSSSARRSRDGGGEGGGKSGGKSGEGESIWDRLNSDSKEMTSKQAAWKKERERREIAACTFKPTIHSTPDSKRRSTGSRGSSSSSTSSSTKKKKKSTTPVWERLSNVNIGQAHMLRDEIKKKKELEECTFQPQLSHHRRKGTTPKSTNKKVPIWERLNAEAKDPKEIEKLKIAHELEGCTFSPSLSKETAVLTQQTPTDAKPIWDRLYQEAETERKELALSEQKKLQNEMEECTFAPAVLPSSQAVIDALTANDVPGESSLMRLSQTQTESSRRHSVSSSKKKIKGPGLFLGSDLNRDDLVLPTSPKRSEMVAKTATATATAAAKTKTATKKKKKKKKTSVVAESAVLLQKSVDVVTPATVVARSAPPTEAPPPSSAPVVVEEEPAFEASKESPPSSAPVVVEEEPAVEESKESPSSSVPVVVKKEAAVVESKESATKGHVHHHKKKKHKKHKKHH